MTDHFIHLFKIDGLWLRPILSDPEPLGGGLHQDHRRKYQCAAGDLSARHSLVCGQKTDLKCEKAGDGGKHRLPT